MKKALKISGLSILFLVVILLVTPYIFRGKLLDLTKQEINKMLTAKVEFSDFKVSILKNFPDLTVTIGNLEIVGTKQFENDTLLYVQKLLATVDIMTVIQGDSIGVKNIEIISPRIHAIIAADSSANYDIMKSTEEQIAENIDTSSTAFALKLQNIHISNASIRYSDVPYDMYARFDGLSMTIAGNFTESSTLITTLVEAKSASYKMDGISYLSNTKLEFDAIIDANFDDEKYTLKENKLQLNDLELEYNGWLAFDGDDMLMDFSFKTIKTDFKNILSLVPGIFMEGFEDIKTSGKLAFNGNIKGRYSESPETYPSFDIKMLIEDGKFQYPDLPKAVDNIQMNLHILSPTADLNDMVIDLKKLSLQFADNPFNLNFQLKYPMTDPHIAASVNGIIDLHSMGDFIPLDDMKLQGTITPNLQFAAKMSDIEAENYNAITALGKLLITDFVYTDQDFPQGISIPKTNLSFSPQFVEVHECSILIGKSDFDIKGKLENFIAYALAGQTLKGTLSVNSKFFDANELLGEETPTESSETENSDPLEIIEVPDNIDFVLQSQFGRILYDVYDIANLQGKIIIKNRKVSMEKLSMNMLGGSMLMSGHYYTPDNAKPDARFSLKITNFDIAQTFKTFNTVQQLAPIAKFLQGSFSTNLDFNTLLEKDMMPDLKTLQGIGEFTTSSIKMENAPMQTFMVNNLKQDQFKSIVANNILMFFSIENGNITVKPFETNFNSNKAIIEGKTGLDQSIDYKIAMQIPTKNLGSAANTLLQSLSSSAASKGIATPATDMIDMSLLVGGNLSKPKFTPVLGNLTSGTFNSVKDQAKLRLEQEKERARLEAQNKVDAAKLQAQQEADRKKQELEAKAKQEAQKQTDAAKQELQKQSEGVKNQTKKQLESVIKR